MDKLDSKMFATPLSHIISRNSLFKIPKIKWFYKNIISIDYIILDFVTFYNASPSGYRLGLVDTSINTIQLQCEKSLKNTDNKLQFKISQKEIVKANI